MQHVQSTQSVTYTLMILLAGFAVMANYGRDAAVAAPNGPEAPMSAPPAYASVPGPVARHVAPMQYGLVQTGVVAVAGIDGMGRHSIMPVFQVIQLHPASALAAANPAALVSRGALEGTSQQPVESKIPQGINVAPPSGIGMSGTLCEIKGVRVLTETPEACGTAGGQVPAL